MPAEVTSYLEQLERLAAERGVDLKRAFKQATGHTSHYYRALHGASLHLATAKQVAAVIERTGKAA